MEYFIEVQLYDLSDFQMKKKKLKTKKKTVGEEDDEKEDAFIIARHTLQHSGIPFFQYPNIRRLGSEHRGGYDTGPLK